MRGGGTARILLAWLMVLPAAAAAQKQADPTPHAASTTAGAAEPAKQLAVQWSAGQTTTAALVLNGRNPGDWRPQEWRAFLNALPRDLGVERMEELDADFHLTQADSVEVTEAWLLLSIANHYRHAGDRMDAELMSGKHPRMIFALYQEMAKKPEWKRRAVAYFQQAQAVYSPELRQRVAKLLGVE